MTALDPKFLLGIGFLLLVVGVALPFLMILHLITSTLLLNFLAFTASLVGLILGMIGAMMIVIRNRHKRDR